MNKQHAIHKRIINVLH